MFELHIEQGPILEAEGKTIGIVQGVQGMRWYDVTVTGKEAHTGSTPMMLRRNALLGAAKLFEAVDRIAKARLPAVGTVGLVEVKPNSRNVIPGEVFFSVDFRNPDAAVLEEMEAEFGRAVAAVRDETGLTVEWKRIWDSPPVVFDADCVASVAEGAAAAGLPAREIVSGPGHDAAYIARICPTSMIFVPCKDGISHNEAEEHVLRRVRRRRASAAQRRARLRPPLRPLTAAAGRAPAPRAPRSANANDLLHSGRPAASAPAAAEDRPVGEQRRERLERHRPGDVVSLHDVAADGAQHGELARRLDALRRHLDRPRPAHLNDAAHHRLAGPDR